MSEELKPWMRPMQYTSPDDAPHPTRGDTGQPAEPRKPRPPLEYVSNDTEPMNYRSGDPDAVLDLDDREEMADPDDRPDDFDEV